MSQARKIFSLLLISSTLLENKCWSKSTNTNCFLNTNITLLNKIFNLTEKESESISKDLPLLKVSTEDITFLVYTSKNQTLFLNSTKAKKELDRKCPTKVITHGWKSNGTQQWVQDMAYFYHRKECTNVMVVDWSKHSDENYIHAAAVTQVIGSILGDVLLELSKNASLPLHKIHLIGHSLGAHVSSFAAKIIKDKKRRRVGRISGLDVAGPLFETPTLKDKTCRLTKSDAYFVDCIHTKEGIGFISSLGTVDFYVNGGLIQPKCVSELPNVFSAVACGHGSSYDYFSNTILNPRMYEALACDSYTRFEVGLCSGNRKTLMGDGVSRRAYGNFYVNIDENSKQADKEK